MLERAGLVTVEDLPGTRGGQKLCSCKTDHVSVELIEKNRNVHEVLSVEMPIGAYSGCQVSPTCGRF